MARQWRDSPESVKKVLLQFSKHSPNFSYSPINDAIRQLFVLHTEYEQVIQGIEAREQRRSVRTNFLTLLPLIYKHFSDIQPDFMVDVAPQYYSIGRNLMIPFHPPMVYGVGGKLFLPWFVFWKKNPLDERQNALFVTIVREIQKNNPDLEEAELQILDFSVPRRSSVRALTVTTADDYEIINVLERDRMLRTFTDGYALALKEIERQRYEEETQASKKVEEHSSSNQTDMFSSRER